MFHRKFTVDTAKAISDLQEACMVHGLLFKQTYTSDANGDYSILIKVFSEDEDGGVIVHASLHIPTTSYNWTHQIAMLSRHVLVNGTEPFLGPKR